MKKDIALYGTSRNPLIYGRWDEPTSGGLLGRHQGEVEVSCLTLEMAQLAVAAFTLEVLDASLDIVLAAGEHGVDEAGRVDAPLP